MPEPFQNHLWKEPAGPPRTLIDGIPVPPTWVKQLQCIELDPGNARLRERSANLRSDEKMQALEADAGLKASSSGPALGRREFEQQRAREAQDRHLRSLSSAAMGVPGGQRKMLGLQLPQATRSVSEEMHSLFRKRGEEESSSPAEALNRGRRHNTTRLIADLDMASADLLTRSSPKLRCDHLDRVAGWYDNTRVKDAKDSKEAKERQDVARPAFMTFAKYDRTMSGSLRAEPDEKRYAPLPWDPKPSQKPQWLSRSSSVA